jgi:hypothetical protein
MDKSFNDQELSDIMKEIEALEEGFKAEESKVSSASDVLEDLVEMAQEESVPLARVQEAHSAVGPSAEIIQMTKIADVPVQKAATKASTAMSFKVSGNLNLELQFDVGGKVVFLEVTESGLTLQLDGGMTFTIPLQEVVALKKSA